MPRALLGFLLQRQSVTITAKRNRCTNATSLWFSPKARSVAHVRMPLVMNMQLAFSHALASNAVFSRGASQGPGQGAGAGGRTASRNAVRSQRRRALRSERRLLNDKPVAWRRQLYTWHGRPPVN